MMSPSLASLSDAAPDAHSPRPASWQTALTFTSTIRLALIAAVTAAVVATGCSSTSEEGSDLTDTERAELVAAARQAAADEMYYEVEQVHPDDVTVVDGCAVVVVSMPGVTSQRSTGSAVMRRSDGEWSMVDMVTGDMSLRLVPDEPDCWR